MLIILHVAFFKRLTSFHSTYAKSSSVKFWIMEWKIAGKYKVVKKLGSGAFGDIYHGMCSYQILRLTHKNWWRCCYQIGKSSLFLPVPFGNCSQSFISYFKFNQLNNPCRNQQEPDTLNWCLKPNCIKNLEIKVRWILTLLSWSAKGSLVWGR